MERRITPMWVSCIHVIVWSPVSPIKVEKPTPRVPLGYGSNGSCFACCVKQDLTTNKTKQNKIALLVGGNIRL